MWVSPISWRCSSHFFYFWFTENIKYSKHYFPNTCSAVSHARPLLAIKFTYCWYKSTAAKVNAVQISALGSDNLFSTYIVKYSGYPTRKGFILCHVVLPCKVLFTYLIKFKFGLRTTHSTVCVSLFTTLARLRHSSCHPQGITHRGGDRLSSLREPVKEFVTQQNCPRA